MRINVDLYTELLPMQPDELAARVKPDVAARVQRLRALYAYWMQFSALTDREMVEHDIKQHGTGRSAAYEDIAALKVIVGQLTRATADFHRWRMNAMLERDMEAARAAEDWKSLASMQKNYIAANRLDKPDAPDAKLDQILPQQFVPTSDPSVLGITPKKDTRQLVARLLKKYAVDADAEEIK